MKLNENVKGISHIEDLPILQFLTLIQELVEYEVTEKVDGAEILFGIDDNGFYTSREYKGGIRVYSESDYDVKFSTTYMRSAHRILEQALPLLKNAGLKLGDQVEAEVLYGELPNVVPYSVDINYLIFLRTIKGDVDINLLKESVDEKIFSISLLIPYTSDGRNIQVCEKINNWKFTRVPKINIDMYQLRNDIGLISSSITTYLSEQSGIRNLSNLIIESLPLNRCPGWCLPKEWNTLKEIVGEKRSEIKRNLIEHYLPPIKDFLLERLVHRQSSKFGPSLDCDGWIEGVVLRNINSGKMVKLVDKNKFGIIRESAWKERNNLTESAKSINGIHSFLGELKISMANSINHPMLGTIQAKNYLRKIGKFNSERLKILSEGINFFSIREHWLSLFESYQINLEQRLDGYEKTKNNQETFNSNIFNSNIFKEAIDKRILETYSNIFNKINEYKVSTLQSITIEDLLTILIEKQLKDLE